MTGRPDILELIDNAIEDHATSGDAMRWTPGPPAAPSWAEVALSEDGWVLLGYTEGPVEWTYAEPEPFAFDQDRVTFTLSIGGGTLFYRPG